MAGRIAYCIDTRGWEAVEYGRVLCDTEVDRGMIARQNTRVGMFYRESQAHCLRFHQRCLCASQYHYSEVIS